MGASIKKLKAMIGNKGRTWPGFILRADFINLAATIPEGRNMLKIIWHREKTVILCFMRSENLPKRALPMAPAISQQDKIKLIDNSFP